MDYGVKYSIDINGGSASKELNDFLNTANNVIPKVNKRFDSMNTKLKKMFNNINKVQRELKDLNKIKVDLNTKQAMKDVDKLKRKLDKIKNKKVRVTIEQGAAPRRGGAASRRSFGSGSNAFNRSFSTSSMMSAGGIPFATTLGAGLIGLGFRDIISEATQFQHTMVSAGAILRATDKDAASFDQRFKEMSYNMRQLGVDTKFTATGIADATRFLAMAGMNVETIDKSMKSITNLAAIGDKDLGMMADVVTNIMTGYGVGFRDIGKASDAMASVTSRANVDIMEMGESMKYASNYMRMAGIGFSEGSAAIGVLGNAGIKGSLAGTALRAMIIRLISPTTKAQKVIDELGVSFTKLIPDGKGGQKEVLKTFHSIFSELKASGASMKDLKTIFDKVGGGGAMALINNLDKLASLTDSASFAGGTADFLAEEKMKTVVGLSQQIHSKFLDLGQTLFNKISPQLSKMMSELLGWMKTDEASDMFDSITKGVGSVLGGLKKATIFVKDNWGWLKWVLGSAAVKNVAMRGAGMVQGAWRGVSGAGRMLGGLGNLVTGGIGARATAGAASRLGGLSSLGPSAARAAAGLAAAAGSLTAIVAGGAVAAGVGLIAYQFYKVHKAAKEVAEIRSDVSDWSIERTGMNTDSLDALQLRLDNLLISSNKISNSKGGVGKMAKSASWSNALTNLNHVQGSLFASKSQKSDAIANVVSTARNLATGSDKAKNINELFLAFFRETNPSKKTAIMGQLMGLQRSHMYAAGRGKNSRYRSLESMMKAGGGFGAKNRDRTLLNSFEYSDQLNQIALTRLDQIRQVSGLMQGGGRVGGLQAINALLGGSNINLASTWSTVKSRGLTSASDISAALPKGVSVQSIINELKSAGHTAVTIDALMKQSGLKNAIKSTFATTTDIDRISREDDLEGSLGTTLSGTGGLAGRSGKMLVVNIGNMMNVEEANFANEEDLEVAKEKLASALTDVVKDFEISYG